MPYTMADFRRDFVKEHFKDLTPQEREEALRTLSPEEWQDVLKRLSLEVRLQGSSREEIEQYFEKMKSSPKKKGRKKK